jgi:hypothetical protein
MSLKPNPKEINIILNILKGAQFEFLPRAPFYIHTPLARRFAFNCSIDCTLQVQQRQPNHIQTAQA